MDAGQRWMRGLIAEVRAGLDDDGNRNAARAPVLKT
jgi:hypothetical protein